jgi:hypothetical protein
MSGPLRTAPSGERRERGVDRHAQERARLVLGGGGRRSRDARRIDGAEKQRDLLVDEPGRRQIAEQFDQHVRRDADLFDAFAPRGREQRLIRLDVPGDDLDEISLAVGKVGRDAKLADEDDLAAGEIDRQHGHRRSCAQ